MSVRDGNCSQSPRTIPIEMTFAAGLYFTMLPSTGDIRLSSTKKELSFNNYEKWALTRTGEMKGSVRPSSCPATKKKKPAGQLIDAGAKLEAKNSYGATAKFHETSHDVYQVEWTRGDGGVSSHRPRPTIPTGRGRSLTWVLA